MKSKEKSVSLARCRQVLVEKKKKLYLNISLTTGFKSFKPSVLFKSIPSQVISRVVKLLLKGLQYNTSGSGTLASLISFIQASCTTLAPFLPISVKSGSGPHYFFIPTKPSSVLTRLR